MNNIIKSISLILLALFQTSVFAFEVGDTIIEGGVKYFVVEKHFCGRFTKPIRPRSVKTVEYSDCKALPYSGCVFVVGSDNSTKNLTVARNLRYITKNAPSDSIPTIESYLVVGINDFAFANAAIDSIVFPDFMKIVGTGAFRNMSVASGSLWMPYVQEYGEGVFSGLKADIVFRSSNRKVETKLNNTFESADSLLNVIVESHSIRFYTKAKGWPVDNILCYGDKILLEKLEKENPRQIKYDANVERNSFGKDVPKWIGSSNSSFFTAAYPNGVGISVKIKTYKKNEVNPSLVYNDARDKYATPYFYNYDNISSPTFLMNDLFFRLENNGQYVYYTLDGKNVDYSVVADKNGLDPFGTRIVSVEEIERRKAKEVNIQKLDKKADDLMKRFGF